MVISPHHVSAMMVEGRTHRMTEMVARLAPGATVEQARTEVAAVYARMQSEFTGGVRSRLPLPRRRHPLQGSARRARPADAVAARWAPPAFVLIISAANVANLTLMRGVRREHELVRAGRARRRGRRGCGGCCWSRISSLTLLGAGLGVVIAIGGVGCSPRSPSGTRPRASEIRLDGVVLGFTLGAVGRGRAAALVPGLAAAGRAASRAWIAVGGAPDERQP